jgi:DNA-binding NarL/FixJ family response regulator
MEQCTRVLIADDRPRSRDGLKALLFTWPEVEVVGEAADGREAVGLVEDRHPDVVLMDSRMPVMDGLEATRFIKGNWPEVRVIVLTMYASHRTDALAAGADAFLVKGCPAEELLEAILDH